MKNRGAIASLIIVVLAVVISSTGCGNAPSKGTYEPVDGVGDIYTFTGKNSVTITSWGIDVPFAYTIEDDKITFTHPLLGEMTYGYEIKGNSIFLRGKEYKKK